VLFKKIFLTMSAVPARKIYFLNFRPAIAKLNAEIFYDFYCTQIDNSSAKLAFYLGEREMKVHKIFNNCWGIRFDQNLKKWSLGFLFLKNDIYHELVDHILQRILTAGIIQHSIEYHGYFLFPEEKEIDSKDPKVLALSDLSFGFNIWLIACGVSISVLFCELVYPKLKSLFYLMKTNFKNLVGKMLVLIHLRQILKIYRM
jgi:hypothetical protein